MIIYIVIAVLTYDNIYSILPITAAIVYMIFTWYGDELQVKKVAFICYFLWLLYDICILSYAGILSNMVLLISTGIAYFNERVKA